MPHGSLLRGCSTDSPYQQRRGCRHAAQPSHTTPRHARHRHTTTKHWRQMPQMGGQYPGPITIQQTQMRCVHEVQQTVHPSEPRLLQWGCRDAQRAYVHALCITGGLETDHELLPKNPTDTEARDSVIRLRDSVLSAAAAAEVVLPIYDPHGDNSTEAPDDEDRLFDREEALRHDDAIMDFHWNNMIPWSDIKDLRGTTCVQPPTRFRFAIQQAQHAFFESHHTPRSLLTQFGTSLEGANPQSYLETRLDLFWSEDWPALRALVRAECDVAATAQTRSKTKAEQTETRIRKVATLARAGEKRRALAAARNAPPVPVTRDIVQEIKGLYPVDPDPAIPLNNQITHIFYLPNRRIHPHHLEAYATSQRTRSAGNACRTLVRLRYPGRRRQYVLTSHGTHCHGHDPRRSPSIPTRVSSYAVGKTYRRTLTTPHDVVPTSACAQSGYSSQTSVSHRGGRCSPTRSGMQGWGQQDDQIHTVLCGGHPVACFGRFGLIGSLSERTQACNDVQSRTARPRTSHGILSMVHRIHHAPHALRRFICTHPSQQRN